jgi:hypothetical protein
VGRIRGFGWVAVIAAAQFVLLVATSTRYGFHRDELYFIVAGGHPAFGYPDQPPLVPLVSWAMHALAPGSLTLVRLPSALAAVATTILSALVAREAGGSRRAEVIAAGCTASSGFALAVGHFVTTTTFDLLSTTAFLWLLIRAARRGGGPSLLAAGVVVGIGAEAKPQVALVALVAVTALLAVGPREVLWSRWAAGGAAAAVVLAAPYVVWQQLHGWPQLTVAHNIAGSAEGGRIGFIPFQLVMVSPILIPVWIAGLIAPFRENGPRALRFVSITYVAVGLAYLIGDGKAYYLASLYPVLLGIGAVRIAAWARTWVLVAAIGLSAVVSAFIALPLLPASSLQGSVPLAINPDLGEQVGWPRFISTVTSAWRSIPPAERAHTAIFTANYGEAGAVDVLGGALPRAYSGHNGFHEWGMPPASDTNVLLLGYDGDTSAFTSCRRLARIDDGVGLNNDEQGGPVLLCRTTAPWPALWPGLRHYN